jgi:hypothetical protein
MHHPRLILLTAALPVAGLLAAAGGTPRTEPYVPAPVSVSSANYAASTREELLRSTGDRNQINPATRTLEALATPQRYVFMPGELYESDLSYDEICRRLAAALAKKGYLNAVDDQQRVIDPQGVDLILRIHSGERLWRNPIVRLDRLAWRDGMTPPPRGRSLVTLGGEVSWDERAGGNDAALGAAAANENAPGFGYGSTPASPASDSPLTSGSAQSLAQGMSGASEYEATREFYLIVVDAFDYAELRQKGAGAKRLWTTFVAAPRQPGQKFSDVLNTMLRVATPYFGETTTGLQMFNDARAEVILGELVVLPEEPEAPAP